MNKIICAWCNNTLRDGSLPVSHTICPQCLKMEMLKLKKDISKDRDPCPVSR